MKPRICIALPGSHYPPCSTSFLNTFPRIKQLEKDFEITLAVRKVSPEHPIPYRYINILEMDRLSKKEQANQSDYYVPRGLIEAWRYLQDLDRFAKRHAKDFDLVIERQWYLTGALSAAFKRHQVPSLFILEAEFYRNIYFSTWRQKVARQLLNQCLPHLRRQWIRKADGLIVETHQMVEVLESQQYPLAQKPVYVIPNGIDPAIFYPRDRAQCRQSLGLNPDETLLVYVGSLRRFIQEPGPIIEALGQERPEKISLHMIGDGHKQAELEAIAQRFNAPVVFHGRIPQAQAALYIGAANLCIAPYNRHLFEEDKFTSASLKIPEYLACGRPVLTIPCERMADLTDHEKYGFLVENTVSAYRNFFRSVLDVSSLIHKEDLLLIDLENGTLKNKDIVLSWQDIADKFRVLIDRHLVSSPM